MLFYSSEFIDAFFGDPTESELFDFADRQMLKDIDMDEVMSLAVDAYAHLYWETALERAMVDYGYEVY